VHQQVARVHDVECRLRKGLAEEIVPPHLDTIARKRL
jgi:hypothetical protein